MNLRCEIMGRAQGPSSDIAGEEFVRSLLTEPKGISDSRA